MWGPGYNLNVVHPLSHGTIVPKQGFYTYEEKTRFSDLINDSGRFNDTYYRLFTATFRDLQHSLNSFLFGYWLTATRRSKASWAQVKTGRTLGELLGGTKKTVYAMTAFERKPEAIFDGTALWWIWTISVTHKGFIELKLRKSLQLIFLASNEYLIKKLFKSADIFSLTRLSSRSRTELIASSAQSILSEVKTYVI